MATERQQLGARGEVIAEAWLTGRGYTTLVRNYRCPYGEIDRVMRIGDTIAFVEVKTRRGVDYGAPAEAVTPSKRRRITRSARYYIGETDVEAAAYRFDVVEILLVANAPPRIRHLAGVFDAGTE